LIADPTSCHALALANIQVFPRPRIKLKPNIRLGVKTLGSSEQSALLPNRDDFSTSTKDTLARRVGHRCSNPGCCQPTSGPQENRAKSVNVGVAAHISAAAEGGPRYDSSLTPALRAAIENGIWLCQICAKLVDNDPARFTAAILLDWKSFSEKRAQSRLENRSAPEIQDPRLLKIERLMPELMAEMRQDLASSPLCRELIAISRRVTFCYPQDRRMFTYYLEDHVDLLSKLMILQNHGFIRDIRHNDVPRFAFEEEFADYLEQTVASG